MLVWMPPLLKGVIVMLGMAVNTVILVTLLVTVALFKLMIPVDFWIKLMTRLIIWIAELWMSINNALQRLTQKTVWEVQGMEDLQHAGWYFVVSNHQLLKYHRGRLMRYPSCKSRWVAPQEVKSARLSSL